MYLSSCSLSDGMIGGGVPPVIDSCAFGCCHHTEGVPEVCSHDWLVSAHSIIYPQFMMYPENFLKPVCLGLSCLFLQCFFLSRLIGWVSGKVWCPARTVNDWRQPANHPPPTNGQHQNCPKLTDEHFGIFFFVWRKKSSFAELSLRFAPAPCGGIFIASQLQPGGG